MFSFFKLNINSTYAKVITLLTAVSVGLLLLVIGLYYYMRIQEKQIFKTSSEVYKNEIETLIDLNSESYTSVSVDATYWDEFVDYVTTKDSKWFNLYFDNYLETYNIDYVGVYTNEGDLIDKVSSVKIKTEDLIPKEAIYDLVNKKIDNYYLKTPDGVVEVFGATIHPSDDAFKSKYKPAGCFFMARVLDNKYFADMEKISTSNIKFYEGNESAVKTVFSIFPLKDYKGEVISSLYFKRAFKIDFWITKTILLVMGFAVVFSWFIYFIYAYKWAKLPIACIKRILKSGDDSAIEGLKNIKGEFRYIGKLFEENKRQTKEIEIAKLKAEESDRLKSAFLMNLSHEIRTPMNAILGFSDLLANPNLSADEKRNYINVIQKSGKNLIEIIDDLVEMSKIDSELIKPNSQAFKLNHFIHTIASTYKTLYENENVLFELNEPKSEEDVTIISDQTKLNEIITNLLNNAFKFTTKGTVRLSYFINEQEGKINFSISDTGIGIPEDFQENIFKRFTKLSSENISGNEGLGLGLAITKAYVELLGGKISFDSKENEGTTFYVSIPLEISNDEIKVNESDFEIKNLVDLGKEEIILVAEDDNINYLLIEKILKPLECTVIRAKDGVEAVELCKENDEIDIVLMDIRMPNMNGYDAFKKIREFNVNIPIIAQTSYSFEEELNLIKELGFNGFLSKPLDKEKLYDLIKLYLKK